MRAGAAFLPTLPAPGRVRRRPRATMSAPPPLSGRVALVTGASRGIGRGVAVALAEAGAKVFVTGRSVDALQATAELAKAAAPGGAAVVRTMVCDHGDDESVRRCFEEVCAGGEKLDVLVNNAFQGAGALSRTMGKPYWEKKVAGAGEKGAEEESPGMFWDQINGVGLRSNYVAMVHATRVMVRQGSGLIVNISSFGGVMSIFDSVYGAGKQANDRMICELAANLVAPVDTGVRAFTLYPGLVSTELMTNAMSAATSGEQPSEEARRLTDMSWNAESPLYVGRVIAAIAADPDPGAARRRQGNIVIAAEAGNVYGVRDAGGEKRYSQRSLKSILFSAVPALRTSPAAAIIPDLLVPWGFVRMAAGAGPDIVR